MSYSLFAPEDEKIQSLFNEYKIYNKNPQMFKKQVTTINQRKIFVANLMALITKEEMKTGDLRVFPEYTKYLTKLIKQEPALYLKNPLLHKKMEALKRLNRRGKKAVETYRTTIPSYDIPPYDPDSKETIEAVVSKYNIHSKNVFNVSEEIPLFEQRKEFYYELRDALEREKSLPPASQINEITRQHYETMLTDMLSKDPEILSGDIGNMREFKIQKGLYY